ncbi:MAG: hypothetical protein E7616_07470 [Ruminococcaceae bacterium]|nr:hypothetical protein [Oscillospiraceae bacterium]
MNHRKTENAEFLMDAIGGIDDRIIAMAQTPAAITVLRRKHRFQYGTLAACLCLVISLFVFSRLLPLIGSDKEGASPAPPDSLNDSEETELSLSQLLTDGRTNLSVQKLSSSDKIDYFPIGAQIIWQMPGDDTYYTLAVTNPHDLNTLRRASEHSGDPILPDEGTAEQISVWINYADGSVISPHLKKSDGNTAYKTLFAYSPEITPNETLCQLVDGLLKP